MQTYKPKKKPFWENPLLQIAVIVIIAGLLVKNIMGNSATSILGKRTQHSQGYTRSERKGSADSNGESAFASSSESEADSDGVDNTRGALNRSAATAEKSADGLADGSKALGAGGTAAGADNGAITFKLMYAEITSELAAKWSNDANNLGYFQSLPEYSVGILYDFRKRGDSLKQILKAADINVLHGSSAVNLSGVMTDDGSQLIGFATTVELKPAEVGQGLQGSILVTKNSRQGTENFPSFSAFVVRLLLVQSINGFENMVCPPNISEHTCV